MGGGVGARAVPPAGRADVRPEPLDGPVAQALVADLVVDLQVRYGHEDAAGRPLDPAEVTPPRGTFLVARLDGRPVGCAGLRTVGDGLGEVKRMWVDPSARGRGLARLLLAELEGSGRDLGLDRLVLETGTVQPESVQLYASAGWQRAAPYGEWRDSPRVICFERDLRTADRG